MEINTEKPIKRFLKMKSLLLYIPLLILSNKIFNKFNVFDVNYWADYTLSKGSHKIEILLTDGLLFTIIFSLIHYILPPFMTLIKIKNSGTERTNKQLLKITGQEINKKVTHEIKIESIRNILYWFTCIILISFCIGVKISLIVVPIMLILIIYTIGIFNSNIDLTQSLLSGENDNC